MNNRSTGLQIHILHSSGRLELEELSLLESRVGTPRLKKPKNMVSKAGMLLLGPTSGNQ